MRRVVYASLLALALTYSAHAGEIPNNVTATGEIPNNVKVAGEIPNDGSADGHIPNGGDVSSQQTVEVVLSLMQSVLTLF